MVVVALQCVEFYKLLAVLTDDLNFSSPLVGVFVRFVEQPAVSGTSATCNIGNSNALVTMHVRFACLTSCDIVAALSFLHKYHVYLVVQGSFYVLHSFLHTLVLILRPFAMKHGIRFTA